MEKLRINKHHSAPWLCVLASFVALHAEGADNSNRWLDRSSDSDEGIWMNHFRLGGFVGMNIKADFKLSGTFAVSGSSPGQSGVGGVNHFYDDGYVRLDDTGNAGGYTSYWGYNNALQFDGANTLTFHSANSYTTSGGAEVSASPQIGVDLAYGGHLYRMGSAFVGWELGFGWLPINIKDDSQLTATVSRTVHQFDTAGIVVPTAPYNGGSSGLGSTIRDTATALPDDVVGGASVGGSRELDVTLYNFRLGPTVHWELHPKIAMAVSGGAAMGIINGDLKFNETLNFTGGGSANSSGSFSDTQLTYGGYLAGKLMYHAVENGDYYIAVQYMPMSSVTFSGGGREARLNMSGGLYISAGVNWPF